ncbi:hypothetical protein R1flu_023199 [Riccia fluitans]|uniref:Uncharacterized protein n=1 Tax=Riccia fluitans TaxID=41844 RepID=A0ABD1XRC6_9MARC
MVFWKKEELELVRHSSLHRETVQRKEIIGAEYAAVQPALQKCSHLFGQRIAQADFKHAYATVCSRAWGIEALQMLALRQRLSSSDRRKVGRKVMRNLSYQVPFVDFFNHESYCQALLSYDEEQGFAEVLADRDYAVGTQVFAFLA